MDGESASTVSQPRSKTTKLLFGCLGGCGLLALILVGSCVGFVSWLNRPGELVSPERLRGDDTTAYVEWTFRLEDPGTETMVQDLLAGMRALQARANSPLPPVLGNALQRMQAARNERQFRQLFPFVVAWTVVGGGDGGDELHLFTASVEKLGNRIVLADWVAGLLLGRSPEVDVVRHGGEKIYVLRQTGSAFFLRRSAFFFTSDLDTAERAVDRLAVERGSTDGPTELDRLLDALPADAPLRGASLNGNGEIRFFVDLLTGENEGELLDSFDWSRVHGMTLAGGFTEESAFAAALTLLTDPSDWSPEELAALTAVLSDSLGSDDLPTEVELVPRADRLEFDFELADLPGLLRRRVDFDEP